MTASRTAGSALAAAILLLLAACAGPQATQRETPAQQPEETVMLPEDELARSFYDDGRVRVALLAPMSGEHAPVGQALVNAAQMALFDVADDSFALTVKDTGAGGPLAGAAFQEAVDEGAQLVLGPLFADDVRAVSGQAARAEVPLLAFSNDRSLAQNGVYVMGLTPNAEVDRVVDHAARNGLRRIGLLAPQSAYGEAVVAALRGASDRYGAEMVEMVTYDPRAADFSGPVRQFAQRGGVSGGSTGVYDAIMLPAGGRELLSLAAQLAYYDVNSDQIQYLGTRLWEDASLGAEPSLNGGWFAAPPRGAWERFAERYADIYGSRPPRIASIAYDTTALAAALTQDAARNGGDLDHAFPSQALENADGFAGVDGLFRLRPNGNVERGLAVYELQREGFQERESAPSSFVPLVN